MPTFFTEIAGRYPQENTEIVVNGAGLHTSKAFEMSTNLKLLFLPPYPPELNPQKRIRDELREKNVHNKTFDSQDLLENCLLTALKVLETQAV